MIISISSTVRVSSSWQAQLILVSICWKLGLWTQMSFCSPPTLVPIKTQVVPFCYFILKKKVSTYQCIITLCLNLVNFVAFFFAHIWMNGLFLPLAALHHLPPKNKTKKNQQLSLRPWMSYKSRATLIQILEYYPFILLKTILKFYCGYINTYKHNTLFSFLWIYSGSNSFWCYLILPFIFR